MIFRKTTTAFVVAAIVLSIFFPVFDFNKASAEGTSVIALEKLVKKVSDTEYAEQIDANFEEIVDFKLKITNTGEVDLTDINVSDILPVNLTYVADTLIVPEPVYDGELFSSEGLNVHDLAVGESMDITFQAKVAFEDHFDDGETILTNSATAVEKGSTPSSPDTKIAKVRIVKGDIVEEKEENEAENPPVQATVIGIPSAQCLLPNSLGDNTTEVIYPGNQGTLQERIDIAGYENDVATDQKQYQNWIFAKNSTTFEVEYIGQGGGVAAGNIFGYYLDENHDNFVPIFRAGNQAIEEKYNSLPIFSQGQKTTVTINSGSKIAFGVVSDFMSTDPQFPATITFVSTENSKNSDGNDHAVAYDAFTLSSALPGDYIIGFEDRPAPYADNNFNDVIVRVREISCENVSAPVNTPPTITLIGANPLNLNVGDNFVEPGFTATDLEDGDTTTTTNVIVTGSVSTSTAGTYVLTYSVTDSGGLSTSTTRTVVVNPAGGNGGGNGGGSTPVNINIIASKIVCSSESDLPNWGLGGSNITANTAVDFVASHPNCHLEPGWKFQVAEYGASDPGASFLGEAAGWNTFGPTNNLGVATTSFSVSPSSPYIWMREVLKDGYIPFTYPGSNNPISAEIYCHVDVLNYDNYDSINSPFVSGSNYYCVAFNVAKSVTPPVNTPPTITLIGANPLNITVGTPFVDPGATANDLEDGNLTSVIVRTGSVNASTTGSYTLTYVVKDSGNLYATTTRVVNVNPVVCTSNCGGGNTTPTLSLTADPSTINQGASSTLTWTSTNTSSCSAAWTSATSTSGTLSVAPGSTTEYAMTCTGSGGSVSATTTVTVNIPSNPPVNPPGGGGGGGGGIGGHRHPVVVGEILGATSCSYLRDYLKIDWNNDKIEVLKLQSFLNVFEKENLSLTGVFDQTTFDAVVRFQTKYSSDILEPWGDRVTTGFVYILTKKKINEIYCNTIINLNQADKDEIEAFRNYVGDNVSGNTGVSSFGESNIGTVEATSADLVVSEDDSNDAVVVLKDNPLDQSIIRNAAISLFALPQRLFGSLFDSCGTSSALLLLILIALLVIIVKLFSNSVSKNKNISDGNPIPPAVSKSMDAKDSPVIILPGVLPDEEIIIENPEEGPEETVISTPDFRNNK